MDILIVIANADLSRVIGDVLRREGHSVWEAGDARTAFRALMSRLPDLVLLDTKLPDISGIDVLRALRESPGGRGVDALLVADDPLRTRWEARDLYPERVLSRPVDVLDLTDLVRELAARRGDDVPDLPSPAPPTSIPPTSIPPTPIPPVSLAPRPASADAWGVLGIPRGSPPNVIQAAVESLVAQYSEAAVREKSLDARARAASMVARVRAARRELLGDAASPTPAENE